MPRSTWIVAAAVAGLLAVGAATATAGGTRAVSYIVDPTTLGTAPTPVTAGVYGDGLNGDQYLGSHALSRLYNDPDGDFFTFMTRTGRSFRLVVPGHVNVSCTGTSVVRARGGQWFPETLGGGAATDAHVLCPRPDGSEWRVFYRNNCVTVSSSGSELIGSIWMVTAPASCPGEVQFKSSGKQFTSIATASVPFVMTGTVASMIR